MLNEKNIPFGGSRHIEWQPEGSRQQRVVPGQSQSFSLSDRPPFPSEVPQGMY